MLNEKKFPEGVPEASHSPQEFIMIYFIDSFQEIIVGHLIVSTSQPPAPPTELLPPQRRDDHKVTVT